MTHDIEAAKLALPLDRLMEKLGDGHLCKPKSKCPFHDDQTDSFSTFRADDGVLLWKCHAGCGAGDSVNYVAKKFGLSTRDSIARYCELAGTNGPTHREPAGEVIVNTFSWSRCVANVTEKDTADIAKWRGYDPSFVEWLKFKEMLGCFESFPAFAVTDDKGLIVGCHYRKGDGTWRYGPGEGVKTSPLVIGDLKTATEAHVHEGAWDLFAEIERMGWHFDGFKEGLVLVATRGAGNAKTLAGKIPKTAKVVLWPQNDKAKKAGEKTPAEKWTAAMKDVIEQEVTIANVPAEYKDLNDWTRAGATPAMLNEVMEAARQIGPEEIPWKYLFDFKLPPKDDPNELIKYRFLCKGGSLLLVAPTGIGKSTFFVQCMILWAIGRSCFDYIPTRPMKILLIQAENDDGDIAEQMVGIVQGLKLQPRELVAFRENMIVITDDARAGTDFLENTVAPALKRHRPDIVGLDPMNSYLGGDSNSQKEVGAFLRNGLNPLLHKYECGCVAIHHTNKPATGKEKAEWSGGDFAYLGAGSAEWANWARAVVVIRSLGDKEVYELRNGKRGGRTGWLDAEGNKTKLKYIKHSADGICWEEATIDDVPKNLHGGGRKSVDYTDDMLEQLGESSLIPSDWQKLCAEVGVPASGFWRTIKDLEANGMISKFQGVWRKKYAAGTFHN